MTTPLPKTTAVETWRAVVEGALDRFLVPPDAWPATIHEAMRYSVFAGGKRIRPALVLAAGEAVGSATLPLLPYACAVEMIHTYSLIHDDLPAMDNDDLRRGKPTSHKVYGEAVAILAGDALLTRAFEVLSDASGADDGVPLERWVEAMRILAQACGTSGLIGGQIEDLASEGRPIEVADLERIHRAKTGALLRACVLGGGILGGASASQRAALERFSEDLGLAFQVVDDILDATEGEARLGKTAGKDAAAGKATYVALHGLDGAQRRAGELLQGALEALSPLGTPANSLRQLAHLVVERRE